MSVRHRSRVVIGGGGVAALEGLLTLQSLLHGQVAVEIVAPQPDFVYRPLAVAEPFGLSETRRISLAEVAARHSAGYRCERISSVAPDQQAVRLANGDELHYDALLLALGARAQAWLPGTVSFAGPESVADIRTLIAELEAGEVTRVVFTAPVGGWTLPLYELALLTAARARERRWPNIELSVATPERRPLEVFGATAGRVIRDLLAANQIGLETDVKVERVTPDALRLIRSRSIPADRVVALPRLEGPRLAGVPADDAGFIPVDEHGAVAGLQRVWAAGDATSQPIKQGGLATQQADAAAEAIAHAFGVAVRPRPFEPLIRGLILTGGAPTYLRGRPRSPVSADAHDHAVAAANPLWWPPGKIAGRYLSPYLAGRLYLSGDAALSDQSPLVPPAAGGSLPEHDEARELIVAMADTAAAWEDYRSALRWLEKLEQLDGILPREHQAKRERWQQRATVNRDRRAQRGRGREGDPATTRADETPELTLEGRN